MWLVALSPLAIVFAMSFGANKFSTTTLQAMFWGFAVLMGLSLSTIFLVYTGGSIAATFFATAGAFAGLSLFGYTTKKDLSGFGSFLIMGVVGLVIASVINLFLKSEALMWAVSFLGVLIFAGLTAYDTQKLKEQYSYVRGQRVGRQGRRSRRAEPVPRLHQHVPVPAPLHGLAAQLIAAQIRFIAPGVHNRTPGVFFTMLRV